ncbi:MAG: DUF1573 domain-containing protein [Planctomycetaceae bacterium]|jgi:hypothetical protein|nr:DUF1573 domain-containing protein [Planctomycetaceae bacterium]
MKRFLFLLFLLFISVVQAEEIQYVEIPPCGIATTYGTFINLGLNISLNDITKRYQKLFPEEDPKQMSLAHLQTLIQSFGLHTLAVQGNLATLDNSQLPAVLCITNTASGKSLPIGHVVLLRSIRGNIAFCTDYQIGIETQSVPLAQLQVISDGKMILVSKNPISLPLPWMLVALWLTVFTSVLGLFCVVYSWLNSKKKSILSNIQSQQNALSLFFMALLLVSGCGKNDFNNDTVESNAVTTEKHVVSTTSKPKPINPFKLDIPEKSSEGSLLLFEKCIQDFGEFQCGKEPFKVGSGGGKVEFLFLFKVGKEDVLIEKLNTSCGCVVSDSQLIGQKLLAGTEHSLKFVMDLRGRCGEFSAFANIVIKPEPKEPIMLKIIAFVKQLPEVVPLEIRCRSIVGKKIENTELNVQYQRDKSVDKMEIDLAKSDFGTFNLIHSDFISEPSIISSTEIRDRVLLKLESKEPYMLGQHEDKLTIYFKNNFEPIVVPVKIQIVPSITLAVDRLFIGEVRPEEEKTMPIRVIVNESKQVPNVRVISVDENIQTRFDEKTMKLFVTVKSPQATGRFEKKMRLTFGSEDSAFDFPISGIVQAK